MQLPSRATKPSWATTKSKWRPGGPATAWLERTVAQGRRPRPGGITGRFSIFFFAERFNSQLSHSNPSQTARAYGSGVTLTRAHRDSDCLNLNTGQLELSSCCLFLNWLAVRRHIAGSNLCFPARLPPNPSGGPAWPGPATVWPKGRRRTLDTSDQVRLHQKITRDIPS